MSDRASPRVSRLCVCSDAVPCHCCDERCVLVDICAVKLAPKRTPVKQHLSVCERRSTGDIYEDITYKWRHTYQPATSLLCKMPYIVAHVWSVVCGVEFLAHIGLELGLVFGRTYVAS